MHMGTQRKRDRDGYKEREKKRVTSIWFDFQVDYSLSIESKRGSG